MQTRDPEEPLFSVPYLDRRTDVRREDGWLRNALADPAARFIVSHGTAHLVHRKPAPGIAFVNATHAWVRQAAPADFALLGWYQGAPCISLTLHAQPSDQEPQTVFEELRGLLPLLSPQDTALLGYARALLFWRLRHRHCGVCGAPTEPRSAGHVLRCTSSRCGEEFFPRTDPAIIVLVTHGSQALLGRQATWPPGRYSALAGFVEAGECLEDAVVREVHEETSVRVRGVKYFASQPWPFPASLMLGFHASAEPDQPVRLDGELEDARWFSAEELQAAPSGMLPPPHTIARHLIEHWFERLRAG